MANNHKYKLVITHPSQLSERWVNYYCLDELNKVFDVEFWDCSALAYPSFTVANPLQREYLRVMTSLEQFKENIQKLPKDTILITEVHHNAKTYSFHKIQGHFCPITAHIGFYGNDIDRIWPSEKNGIKGIVPKFKDYFYRSKTIKRFIKWLFHHKDADYYENIMKTRAQDCYKYVFSMSCVKGSGYQINHPDFERYLIIKNQKRLIEDRYIVFIDDFYPYHPELFVYHEINNLDEVAEAYHKSMNRYFDFVENNKNCKDVIAAHPYANYKEKNPFNGRDIYYGQTPLLIKDCEAVCMHCSNAYSYVALFNKPVAFVTNNALEISTLGFGTRLYGEKLCIEAINIDDSTEEKLAQFAYMDNELRLKYIDDYLGNLSNPISNKELFIKYLNEFHDKYLTEDE